MNKPAWIVIELTGKDVILCQREIFDDKMKALKASSEIDAIRMPIVIDLNELIQMSYQVPKGHKMWNYDTI